MAITTRTLLVITFIGFSVLCLSLYLYSNSYYKNKQFPPVSILSSNGTKISTDNKQAKSSNKGTHDFMEGFIASITVIIITELGDKTFFIAAIMAMRHSRLIIYTGAMSALGTMTILSALLGHIVTTFIPRIYTFYLSCILFACFGVKMLKEGYGMSPGEGTDEYEEVQHEVEKAEANDDLESGGGGSIDNTSKENQQQQKLASKSRTANITAMIRRYISAVFIQAFVMTFLAEWGDRSQIATIVLAAGENMLGVIIGGTIGHGLCTGLAVIGGRYIAQCISPRAVTLVGGVVFLCFALSAFVIRPDK